MAPSPGISLCTSSSPLANLVAPYGHPRGRHHLGQAQRRSHFPRSLPVLCYASLEFYILFSVVTVPSAISGVPLRLTPLKKTISGFSFSSSSFTPSSCRVSRSTFLPFEQQLAISRSPARQDFVLRHRWFAHVAYLSSFSYHSPVYSTPVRESHQGRLLSRDVPSDLALHSSMGSRIGVAPRGLCVSSRSPSLASSFPSYSLPADGPMFGEEVQLGCPKYRKGAVRSRRRRTPKFPYEPKDPVFYAPPLPPPDVPLPPGVSSPSRLRLGEENAELETDGFHGKHDRAAELPLGGRERQGESVSRKEGEKASETEGRVGSGPRREECYLKETTPGSAEVRSSVDPSPASDLFDLDAVGGDYTLRVPPIDKRARRTLWIHRHLSRRSGTVSPVQEGVTDLLLSHDAPDDVLLNLSESSGEGASSSGSSSCSSPYLRMLRSLAFPGLLNFSAEELKCLLSRYPALLLPRRAESCKNAVSWFTRERNWSPKAVRSLLLHVPTALAQGVPGVSVWFREFEDLFDRGGEGVASPSRGTKEEAGAIQEGDPLEPTLGEVVEEPHSRRAAQPDSGSGGTQDSQHSRETGQNAGATNEQIGGREGGGTLSRLEQIAIDSPMVFNVRRPKAKITHFIKVWRQVRASRSEYRPAGWRARPAQDSFLSSGASSPGSHSMSFGGGQRGKVSAEETAERVCAGEPKGENWRCFLDLGSSELEWYRAHYECLEAFTGEGLPGIEQGGRAGLQADADRLRRVMAQEEIALQELFLKYPRLFTMRVEGNVRSKLLYLQNNMLKELEEVLAFPQFLSYSLRRRIIPRHIALVNVFLKREREKRKATSALFDEGKLVAATRKAGRVRRHWDSRMHLKRKLTAQLRHRRQQLNPSISMYDREFWEQKELLQEELLPIVDDRKGWRGIEPYQPLSMPALPPLREMFATSDETFRELFEIPYQDFVGARLDAERVKNPQALF